MNRVSTLLLLMIALMALCFPLPCDSGLAQLSQGTFFSWLPIIVRPPAPPTPTPTPIVHEVIVPSHSEYEWGDYWVIVGEVQNGLTSNVRFVEVRATYYSQSGAVLGTTTSYARHDILIPGQTSPFMIMRQKMPGYHHCSLRVTYSPTTIQPVPQLPILGVRRYTVGENYTYVLGEVQNTTMGNLRFVEVLITYYDAQQSVVRTDLTYVMNDILVPGQRGPFRFILSDMPPSALSWRLTTNSSITTQNPPALRCVNTSRYVDGYGWLHFAGEIENTGPVEVSAAEAIVTLYDSTGRVVNVGSGYGSPISIPPGERSPYEIVFFSGDFEGYQTYHLYPPES